MSTSAPPPDPTRKTVTLHLDASLFEVLEACAYLQDSKPGKVAGGFVVDGIEQARLDPKVRALLRQRRRAQGHLEAVR